MLVGILYPVSSAMLVAASFATVVTSAIDIPSLNPKFCADMVDEMKANNETKQLNKYRLCMDATTGSWITDGLGGERAVGIGKVVDGQYRSYMIQKESAAGPATCSYNLVPGPPSLACFPCQFIIIDPSPNTTVERDVPMDGLTCDHWQDVRRTPDGSIMGTMNWWVNPVDVQPDLVRTAYVSPDASSVGSRDFHANHTRDVPEDVVFDERTYLTDDVECQEHVGRHSASTSWDAPAFGSHTGFWSAPVV